MNNYVILHCHTMMSNGTANIDSVTKYEDYVKKASELGMTSLAFSEHGNVFAWYDKKQAIEAAGMKYIHAEEFYITEKIETDEDGKPIKIKDNWHCLLIAKNYDGVRELNRLASKSFNRSDGHYFYSPRIELSDLFNTSSNIIMTSACLGGLINKSSDETRQKILQFMQLHKDRCFLEVQHHMVQSQINYNQRLLEISKQTGIRLIAGTDTHSLNEEHARGRLILQKAKGINFGDEDGWDLTFKTYDELCDAYKKQGSIPEREYLEAINNTNVVADMIEEFTVDRHTKYPHIYDDPETTFKQKINKAFKTHPYATKNNDPKKVIERVREEFDVYKKVGAIDFMLLETYIREWEKENGIHSGFGRGSVSGSMIAYLLGITQMDSLRFNLNFFR